MTTAAGGPPGGRNDPMTTAANGWATAAYAGAYLDRGPEWPPHRFEGEAVMLSLVGSKSGGLRRVVDLGTGDGRLLAADQGKAALYAEVAAVLEPGGWFCNLEHVASPTAAIHAAFFEAIGSDVAEEDPSNELVDVATQLRWLDDAGFVDVDCYWKRQDEALLAGVMPIAEPLQRPPS